MKKLICCLLSTALLFTAIPSFTLAEETELQTLLTDLRTKYINTADSSKDTVFENINFAQNGYIYSKHEITFGLNLDYTNPFDPEDISVNGIFTYPDGSIATVPAFYIEEMEYKKENTTLMDYYATNYSSLGNNYWCVRFSGDAIGTYSFFLQANTADGGCYFSEAQSFELLNADTNGFIEISDENPEYFTDSADGSLFYGTGSNIAWVRSQFTADPTHLSYEYFINQAAQSGANLTRVWLCHWAWLEWMPDTADIKSHSYAGLGYYNQCISSALDNIFSMCEEKGIRLILTLDDNNEHGNSTKSDGTYSYDGWAYNPYNSENGGPAVDTTDYWSNTEVRRHYKNRLRYIIARWGYSTSLMSLNLWNDQTTPTDAITEYLSELNSYTKELTENYRTLLFSSNFKYGATDSLDYSTQNTANGNSGLGKPVISQECYYSSDNNYFKSTLKNTLWEEFFSFGASAMVWSHDTVDETDSWGLFGGLLKFANGIPLNKTKYLSHYSISSFVSTWDVNDKDGNSIRPSFSIQNGKLCFTTSDLVTSNVTMITDNPSFSSSADGITFWYDTTELENTASLRINLSCKVDGVNHNYMPWYGSTYYFTPDGGEAQTLTVGGSHQWASFLRVNPGQSGTYFIPFESLNVPKAHIEDTNVSSNYKFNIFDDVGQKFTVSFQQQATSEGIRNFKIDDVCWMGDNYSSIIQDFSLYTASSPLSAEYSNISAQSFKTITAKALGDVSGWAEKATENQFTINESDSDLLLAGISSKLYGTNSSIAPYRNDPTFTVNCTAGGEMVIELAEYGSGTNYLTVTNNGEEVQKVTLTGGRAEVTDEQRYVRIALKAGTNVITVANTGHDWIAISAYHFKFYMQNTDECVTVKRMISENQQLALVRNSKSGEIYQKVFEGTADTAINVKIPFLELENAQYRFDIYNTETGITELCEIVNITDNRFYATVSKVEDTKALKLTKFRYGDVSNDNTCDLRDLIRLKKYLAGIKTEISIGNSDISFDGELNTSDLTALRQYLIIAPNES